MLFFIVLSLMSLTWEIFWYHSRYKKKSHYLYKKIFSYERKAYAKDSLKYIRNGNFKNRNVREKKREFFRFNAFLDLNIECIFQTMA